MRQDSVEDVQTFSRKYKQAITVLYVSSLDLILRPDASLWRGGIIGSTPATESFAVYVPVPGRELTVFAVIGPTTHGGTKPICHNLGLYALYVISKFGSSTARVNSSVLGPQKPTKQIWEISTSQYHDDDGEYFWTIPKVTNWSRCGVTRSISLIVRHTMRSF
jgi:hypothetical protein